MYLPPWPRPRRGSRDATVLSDLSTQSQALSLYSQDNSDYPPADIATNDKGGNDLGNDCGGGQTGWQSLLVSSKYINQSITLPAGANYACYWHRLTDGANGETQTEYNYCSLGLACGFSGRQFADYLSCASALAKNTDGTRDIPKVRAAIFFWLENGNSNAYPSTGSNPWFDPSGNAICLN